MVDRFEVVRVLARGGMGEVSLARTADRFVVLKRPHPAFVADPEFRAAFLEEARALARIRHPNVVRVLELGEAQGELFLALEYVHGVTVEALREAAPVPVALACALVTQAARALTAVHRAQVVHADLSPRNLLVGADGVLKLIDFGLAGKQGGALGWSSPEALEGQVTAAGDQFSLGVVLWELLTGRPLFDRPNDVATHTAVMACVVPPVPGPLSAVVATMLAREPTQRFPSLAEVEDALTLVSQAHRWAPDVGAVVRRLAGPPPELAQETRSAEVAPRVNRALNAWEVAALAQLQGRGELTFEEAEATLDLSAFPEAPWALDVVQALVEAGALSRRARADGELVFRLTP